MKKECSDEWLSRGKRYWGEHQISNDDVKQSFLLQEDAIIKLLGLFDWHRILEVGCGPFGMIYFIPNAKKKIGIDPLINFYKNDVKFITESNNLVLTNTSGEKLDSIENTSIDVVIVYNVLDHTSKPDEVISEIYRVLKNEGIVYINCHIIRGILCPVRKLLKIFDPAHPHHFSQKDIQKLLEMNQFKTKKEILIKSRYDVVSLKTILTRFYISNFTIFGEKKINNEQR